jgi:hypothetical protein
MNYSNMTITKHDAALSQVNTAIRIYFSNGDPISIHTLIAATYALIKGLNKMLGGKPMIKEFAFLKDGTDLKKTALNAVHKADNFFKHADRDAEKSLEFKPALTDFFIWECCEKWQELTGSLSPEMLTFRGWFYALHKDNIPTLNPGMRNTAEHIATKYGLIERERYFNEYIDVAEEAVTTLRSN